MIYHHQSTLYHHQSTLDPIFRQVETSCRNGWPRVASSMERHWLGTAYADAQLCSKHEDGTSGVAALRFLCCVSLACRMPVEHILRFFNKFPPEPHIFSILFKSLHPSISSFSFFSITATEAPNMSQSLASSAIGSVGTKPSTLPISAPLSWS